MMIDLKPIDTFSHFSWLDQRDPDASGKEPTAIDIKEKKYKA